MVGLTVSHSKIIEIFVKGLTKSRTKSIENFYTSIALSCVFELLSKRNSFVEILLLDQGWTHGGAVGNDRHPRVFKNLRFIVVLTTNILKLYRFTIPRLKLVLCFLLML